MAIFHTSPKDTAGIYIAQTRDQVDRTVTPVFPPDQSLEPGDIVTVEAGQLVRSGSVSTRGLTPLVAPSTNTAPWSYATSKSVSLSPSVQIPNPIPGGSPLLKATLTMKSERSVVASFSRGVQHTVQDADQFGQALMNLWYSRMLRPFDCVVWYSRQAVGGTVVVSAEGDNQIEVIANSALLGGAGITLAGLAAGVTLGTQRKATYNVSDPGITFTTAVRIFWLSEQDRQRIDGFGFADDPDSVRAAAADRRPSELTVDDLTTLINDEDDEDDED